MPRQVRRTHHCDCSREETQMNEKVVSNGPVMARVFQYAVFSKVAFPYVEFFLKKPRAPAERLTFTLSSTHTTNGCSGNPCLTYRANAFSGHDSVLRTKQYHKARTRPGSKPRSNSTNARRQIAQVPGVLRKFPSTIQGHQYPKFGLFDRITPPYDIRLLSSSTGARISCSAPLGVA